MEWGRIRRITIALSAAYAVALQALFLSFVPVSAAALTDAGAVLCSYQDDDGAGHPEHRQIPCVAICAAMGHGLTGAIPPPVIDVFAPRPVTAAVEPLASWIVPVHVEIGPQTSRGPPRL